MITLSSDFGDQYPAAMRGVILRQSNTRLIDVSHQLPRGDVRGSAFWLRFLLPEFPPAVHLVVVDPGVGTDRAAIVLRVGDHALVGPDNGVLLPVARAIAAGTRGSERTERSTTENDHDPTTENDHDLASETGTLSTATHPDIDAFRIRIEDPASATFHGRDVFAPAAAAVHEADVATLESVSILEPTEEIVDLALPTAEVDGDTAIGAVLAVDGFGNVITNVPGDFLADAETVRVNGESVPVGSTFASVPRGDRLVTVGSHGNVECDVNDGRGEEAFGLAAGDQVRIER